MGEFCEFEIDFNQFDDLRAVVVHDECGEHEDVWFYRLDGLKAENAKLRELIRDMNRSMTGCKYHHSCGSCDFDECIYEERMRELGIEVP